MGAGAGTVGAAGPGIQSEEARNAAGQRDDQGAPGAGRRRGVRGERDGGGQHLFRLREPDRGRRLDVPARPRPQGHGEGARRQGDDEIRRERRRGRRRRAGDPRARAERLQGRVHDELRLHELHGEGGEAVPAGHLHARHRLQAGPELRHVQRALLRRPVPDRRDRRQDDEVERPGLCRRVPDPGSAAGDQRVRPGRAQREPEGRGARDLDQFLVRPRQGARGGEHADRAGRRHRDAPHRFDRRRAGRGREGQVRVRLPLRHGEVRPEGAPDGVDARAGAISTRRPSATSWPARGRRRTSGAG